MKEFFIIGRNFEKVLNIKQKNIFTYPKVHLTI